MNNVSLTQIFKGEWLEYIPTDWKQSKIKHLFSIKKKIAGELGHDVISITQRGAKLKDTESGEGQLSMDYSKYQLVNEGDFLMNHMDLLTGFVDISKFNGVTSPDYRVFTVSNENACSKYFLYLFQHGYKSKIFYAYGRGSSQLGRWRFPTVEFEDFYFPIPPTEEQKLISRYLDKKTSQIDSLVEKIQKKIDLLKEQRTSLINHYVTKGLDPNVEMKDSGVEWIGEVPKHWDLIKLKYLFSLEGGKDPKLVEIDDGKYPIFGTGGEISRSSDFLYDKPTLLLGRKGTIDKPFVVTEPFWVSDVMYFTVQKTETTPDYLLKLFNLVPFDFYKYGSTQPSMSRIDYENMIFPIPSEEERQFITKFLDRELIKFETLIEKQNSKSSLLKEYRQSLISSVVTGKVRVTEHMI
jgi:type I restriction enzyme, S subunit